ncbi:MAG: hypothetical protein GYA59_16535, partial [Chloroflexi bacterium]|nr:hypothetical protein [Chloroflexota bacterium]
PLRRVLQKYIESPLSVRLLGGEFAGGDTVLVDVDEKEGFVFLKPAVVLQKTNEPAEPEGR